jgi:hypothetical protein
MKSLVADLLLPSIVAFHAIRRNDVFGNGDMYY